MTMRRQRDSAARRPRYARLARALSPALQMLGRASRRILTIIICGSNLLLTLPAVAGGVPDAFDIPAPSDTSLLTKEVFWATQYYVLSAQNSQLPVPQAYPLLGRMRSNLGAALTESNWCSAALEGTAYITFSSATPRTFNYTGVDPDRNFEQANYVRLYPHLGVAATMTRTLFAIAPSDAPFGLGDQDYLRLVPFRSVAVDRSLFPAQTVAKKGDKPTRSNYVFFIPTLHGVQFRDGNGDMRSHDGYVMAADTGGAIKGQHIDVFTGSSSHEFAPKVIQSTSAATFQAFLVQAPDAVNKLVSMHLRSP